MAYAPAPQAGRRRVLNKNLPLSSLIHLPLPVCYLVSGSIKSPSLLHFTVIWQPICCCFAFAYLRTRQRPILKLPKIEVGI